MPTHAELAARLLNEAAGFFKTVASQNPAIDKDMTQQAQAFEQVAFLVVKEPGGESQGQKFSTMAAKLLRDAARFFLALGEKNPPVAEQMEENAAIFEQIATLVETDPMGLIE